MSRDILEQPIRTMMLAFHWEQCGGRSSSQSCSISQVSRELFLWTEWHQCSNGQLNSPQISQSYGSIAAWRALQRVVSSVNTNIISREDWRLENSRTVPLSRNTCTRRVWKVWEELAQFLKEVDSNDAKNSRVIIIIRGYIDGSGFLSGHNGAF